MLNKYLRPLIADELAQTDDGLLVGAALLSPFNLLLLFLLRGLAILLYDDGVTHVHFGIVHQLGLFDGSVINLPFNTLHPVVGDAAPGALRKRVLQSGFKFLNFFTVRFCFDFTVIRLAALFGLFFALPLLLGGLVAEVRETPVLLVNFNFDNDAGAVGRKAGPPKEVPLRRAFSGLELGFFLLLERVPTDAVVVHRAVVVAQDAKEAAVVRIREENVPAG